MKRKIIAAFLLAIIAIIASLYLTRFSFRQMMETVDQLSEPNEKLVKLNQVFTEITILDQQQRAEAIKNPQKPYKYFLDQSGYLHLMIDSLKLLQWDSTQAERLESLTDLLNERNEIFVSYMKVKAELANNKEFSHQLDTLAALLKESQNNTDSSIITSEQTTVKKYKPDTTQIAQKQTGFFKKLFNRKKKKDAATLKVEEELKIKVDTITIAQASENYDQIQKVIRDLEKDRRIQSKKLYDKELELIHANGLFISQLLSTLDEVQNEELEKMRRSNQTAAMVVQQGITKMNWLVIGFTSGVTILALFIFIDISRSNYYKKQLEIAKSKAEELTKIKQRFLANMSHELRTPLQSIIGFSEHLKQSQPNDESVSAIHSSSEHLLHIVNEVLDYSRISSGTFVLSSEPFNLISLINEVTASMKVQAEKKNISFIFTQDESNNVWLKGDSFRLKQILFNLLGNAIKFTNDGYVKLEVHCVTDENKTHCNFAISDTGIGMSEEELKKIFNQFEQANYTVTKTYGGTGLGLTIVKAIVDAHKGDIQVKSKPGEGSVFSINITFETSNKPEDKKVQQVINEKENLKAVIVDDDAMIVKLCGLILSKNKIQHKTFNSPVKLSKEEFDNSITHFLIDIRMPEMNGVQLCKLLRKKYHHTKFVALTAHVLPEERENLIKQGFDEVLPKPFHESDLLKSLGIITTENNHHKTTRDFSYVRKMTMGDEALFHSIMLQFMEESDDDLQSLREELQSNNTTKIREIIHKLAGRLGQMGIYEISSRLRDIEVELVAGRYSEKLKQVIETCIHDTDELLNDIRLDELEKV